MLKTFHEVLIEVIDEAMNRSIYKPAFYKTQRKGFGCGMLWFTDKKNLYDVVTTTSIMFLFPILAMVFLLFYTKRKNNGMK